MATVYTAPKKLLPVEFRPIVFLAGPVQGAKNWQDDAINYLKDADIVIANPRSAATFGDDSKFDYTEQINWEHENLDRANVVLFWLAKEKEHICTRAYAQTSRFELGERLGIIRQDGYAHIVVGIEPGFTGASYIEHSLKKKAHIQVYTSLIEVCNATANFCAAIHRGHP